MVLIPIDYTDKKSIKRAETQKLKYENKGYYVKHVRLQSGDKWLLEMLPIICPALMRGVA